MMIDSNVKIYGTSDAPDGLKSFQLGPLSFIYTPECIRRISWNGTELLRAVAWPIRDENWGTFAPVILDEQIEDSGDAFTGHLKFSVADGRLTCVLNIHATSDGELRLELTMTPMDGSFATNRAGFTVLHPIKGIAGEPLQVTHSDGAVEKTAFPWLITPGQPVMDIQGMSYGLDGQTVDIAFSGDIFEMEDQRNWSDASYKTYCVPILFPFTYQIDATRTQTINVSLSGRGKAAADTAAGKGVTLHQSDEAAPAIGLVAEDGWMDGVEIIQNSGVGHILARIGPGLESGMLAQLELAARGRDLDLEVVIADADDPATALADARAKITTAGLTPSRIIALREGYLGSCQPSGPWPEGPVPSQVVDASRAAFPDVQIGGGMLTNFTELNRCRPDPAQCDFITHGNCAIVHAGDDLSVCETLETLPQVFESALAIADGKPYRLGLMSIGMRSNPYGAAVVENPNQTRRTMACADPRHRGLFAAAWAVGVLGTTQGHGVEALCLAAPSGPFGIAYRHQSYPQAYFDETAEAVVYPIFHVINAAAAMAGQARVHVHGLPEGVHAYGTHTGTGSRLMIANVSPEAKTLHLGLTAQAAVMDGAAFADVTTQTNWLERAPHQGTSVLNLEGYAVAFLNC